MEESIALSTFQRVYRPAHSFQDAGAFLTTEEILEQLRGIDPNVFAGPVIPKNEDGTIEGSDLVKAISYNPVTSCHNWLAHRRYMLESLDGLKLVWLLIEN